MPPQTYQTQSPTVIRYRPDVIPQEPGVYIVQCRDAQLLEDLGLAGTSQPHAVYIGRSSKLRQRLSAHFRSATTSNLRLSLGLLLADRLGLKAEVADVGSAMWFREERPLTDWIDENLDVSFATTADPGPVEIDLIRTLQPPLNIHLRHGRPSAVRLGLARAALRLAHRQASLRPS